jgi:Fic family protein
VKTQIHCTYDSECAIKHLGEDDRNRLTAEAMSTEAVTTSEIEGEIFDRASVPSSIQTQSADNRRATPAEQAVSKMTVHLYTTFAAPLSDDMLFEWHRMLTHRSWVRTMLRQVSHLFNTGPNSPSDAEGQGE